MTALKEAMLRWMTEKRKKVTGQKNIHHLEIIKTNILSKNHDDHFKNVTSRASTRFSFDLAR